MECDLSVAYGTCFVSNKHLIRAFGTTGRTFIGVVWKHVYWCRLGMCVGGFGTIGSTLICVQERGCWMLARCIFIRQFF